MKKVLLILAVFGLIALGYFCGPEIGIVGIVVVGLIIIFMNNKKD
jgi:hypothetical protein